MNKIWAKVIVNHRVKASVLHDCPHRVDVLNFWENVKSICEALKIPTPVLLEVYCEKFLEFNTLKLKQRDFIENVDFDWLLLENGD